VSAAAPTAAAPLPAGLAPLAAALRTGRGRIALAWAIATFLGLAAVTAGPGISADEAAVLAAAAPSGPVAASASASADVRPAPPPLAPLLARASDATLGRLGLPHRVGLRLPAALAGALLAALLALLGHELAGPAGAVLAPALHLVVPRHLLLGAVATPDGLAVALGLGAVWAYRLSGRTRRRLGAALAAGALLGLAVAARLDLWILLPLLAVHTALVRPGRGAAARRAAAVADEGGEADPTTAALEARLRGIPLALAAMATVGPLVVATLWPSLLAHPLRTLAAAADSAAGLPYLGVRLAEARPPAGYPLVVAALAIPLPVLLLHVGGVVHAMVRLRRARGAASGVDASDELLLLLGVAAPFLAAQAGLAPLTSGVRPWLLAAPFLALLGTRALLAAAHTAWPARARPLAAALALLVLYPAARSAMHAWPALGATWNVLAGGAPGAASLGMQRQEPGEAARAILPELTARARPGARVLWIGVAPAAVATYAADGLLRADLERATDAASADLAVAVQDGGSRDAEYQAWAALRAPQPVAGVFLDEVPLVLVYARPGAWR
jgi:hypothetical protein